MGRISKIGSSLIFWIVILISAESRTEVKDFLKQVDQVLWVVEDLNTVQVHWMKLGFSEVLDLGIGQAESQNFEKTVPVKVAKANLGGAHITWIQPLEGPSVFSEFRERYGDGAMALIHRLESSEAQKSQEKRLSDVGVQVLDKVTIHTKLGKLNYVLMDTESEGKYVLGFTWGSDDLSLMHELKSDNLHNMSLNQYAFAIKDEKNVSVFWKTVGFPELSISHPELGDKVYFGKEAAYDLRQGWQKHGTIAYEWCIPLKGPIVYQDHIKKHGEGFHHLAFSVDDMEAVIRDYLAKGYTVSMAGTWGEKGKPGSGIFTYIDLESAGGVTMELLWNFKE